MGTLRVLARAGRMICDRKALDAGARRFIGRKHDPKMGANGGWPRVLEGVEVDDHVDYRLAVRHGDLVAFDEETAKAYGVHWADVMHGKGDDVPEHKRGKVKILGHKSMHDEREEGEPESAAKDEKKDAPPAPEEASAQDSAPEEAHDATAAAAQEVTSHG
jgi:hypothetical protein